MNTSTPNIPVSSIMAAGELSLEERRRFRLNAVKSLIDRGVGVKRIGANTREVVVRDIQPQTDLAVFAAGAAAGANDWIIDVALLAPAAAPAGGTAWINNALTAEKCLCIYGVFCSDAIPIVSAIFMGVGAANNIRAYMQTDKLYSMLEPVGYMTKIGLWDPLETVRVNLVAMAASAADLRRFGLLGFVLEPTGQTISGPII